MPDLAQGVKATKTDVSLLWKYCFIWQHQVEILALVSPSIFYNSGIAPGAPRARIGSDRIHSVASRHQMPRLA
jgi:hypothetical protein